MIHLPHQIAINRINLNCRLGGQIHKVDSAVALGPAVPERIFKSASPIIIGNFVRIGIDRSLEFLFFDYLCGVCRVGQLRIGNRRRLQRLQVGYRIAKIKRGYGKIHRLAG